MRILHICLSCFYVDGYNYQENVLVRLNVKDGHDVSVIASCETFIDNKYLGYVEPGRYYTEPTVTIDRVAYNHFFPKVIGKKIGLYEGVYERIVDVKPDVILYHGCAGKSLLELKKYKIENPNVKIYVDSHEDFNNSGRNFITKNILHKIINRYYIKRTLPYIEKVLFITTETREFLKECGNVPDSKLEFYPLGGTIIEEEKYEKLRAIRRNELDLCGTDILMLHTGKLDKLKNTEMLLNAFKRVDEFNAKLVIIGSIPNEMKSILLPLIEADERIIFLGWKSGNELQEYLCACDVYLQPGSQSATMQNAICLNNAMMLFPHKSHKDLLDCTIEYVENEDQIKRFFEKIKGNSNIISAMKSSGYQFAKQILDYERLAGKLYE